MNVLIADDEESVLYTLKRVLVKIGCVVETATNGLELVNLWKLSRQALVLSDVDMPGLSGIEACQEIKKLNPAVSIIILTGSSDSKDVALKANLGPIVDKPFSISELTELVLAIKAKH